MCSELLANPLIESFEIVEEAHEPTVRGSRSSPSPGRTTTATLALALELLGAESVSRLARRRPRCPTDVGGVVLPGGFSYGDYLRCGAIARFAPVMDAVARVRGGRRARARHLQRVPDPLRGRAAPGRAPPEPAAQFLCADVTVTVEYDATPFTAACAVGQELVIPVKHGEGNWYATTTATPSLERGQIVLRYAEDVNGSRDRVAGVTNEAGNVLGLMPHPEHAVDPLLGPTGGVRSSKA